MSEKELTHLEKLLEYNWENELKDFEESTDLEISDLEIKEAITLCENTENTEHIFYSLLIMKHFLIKMWES